ncbi:MAG: FAD-dependent oxidoreductase, partial [Chloroflexia bacterium]|nr:FAD-dependent oxidoreductase [Chloroflexia bacterium]
MRHPRHPSRGRTAVNYPSTPRLICVEESAVATTVQPASSFSSLPWETLDTAIGGDLLRWGDLRYEDARHVWNGMIDRRPAAIARVQTVDDVVAAVGFARGHGLEIAVRAGGHNAAGLATVDDGLVIDLRGMNQVAVDPERR